MPAYLIGHQIFFFLKFIYLLDRFGRNEIFVNKSRWPPKLTLLYLSRGRICTVVTGD